jgi:hypothetical protein
MTNANDDSRFSGGKDDKHVLGVMNKDNSMPRDE